MELTNSRVVIIAGTFLNLSIRDQFNRSRHKKILLLHIKSLTNLGIRITTKV